MMSHFHNPNSYIRIAGILIKYVTSIFVDTTNNKKGTDPVLAAHEWGLGRDNPRQAFPHKHEEAAYKQRKIKKC